MTRPSDSPDRRDIQLKTLVNEKEYLVVRARFQASSATSWGEYHRACLLGKRVQAISAIETGATYNVLGEISRRLLVSTKTLKQIKDQVEFAAPDLAREMSELNQTVVALTQEIAEIRQKLIPTET